MRKMKRFLKGVVVAALTGVLLLPTIGSTDVYAADVIDLYNDFIESYNDGMLYNYALVDITSNGMPQILITPDETWNLQQMYSMDNGQFQLVQDEMQSGPSMYFFNAEYDEILAFRESEETKDIIVWKTDGSYMRYYWNGNCYMRSTASPDEDADDTQVFYCDSEEYGEMYSHVQNAYEISRVSTECPIVRVINCKSYISLRTSPNPNASVITTIPLGSYVSWVESYQNGYAYVNYNGRMGYVMDDYLDIDFCTEPQGGDESDGDSLTWTTHVINCKSFISLRTQPNVNASVIMTIPLGAEVSIIDPNAGNGFSYVNYNGDYGYCLSYYLE